MQDSQIKVSVIVPTKNSARTLDACLRSVTLQTYPHIELIVVDNQSTDDTLEIAQKYTNHIYTHGPERSAQRNYGAQKATGTYLCMIDSDMVLTNTLIEECVAHIHQNTVCILTEESFGVGFWAQVKRKERQFYVGNDAIEAPRVFSTQLYKDIGGYNEALTGGEDWELFDRLKQKGVTVYRTDAKVLHDEGVVDIEQVFKKRVLYGKAYKRFRSTGASMVGRGVIQRYVLFIKKWKEGVTEPVLYIGVFVLKCIEFWGAFLGMILGYLNHGMLNK
jgi:glycosyltransferase involved in cell wall biosynthesis